MLHAACMSIVSTHTHIHTRSSHQVGNKIEDEEEDESEDGSDEMLNLEDMDEDGDLEVGCLSSLSQLDVQDLAQENDGFHTCILMQYSHMLGVSDDIIRHAQHPLRCKLSRTDDSTYEHKCKYGATGARSARVPEVNRHRARGVYSLAAGNPACCAEYFTGVGTMDERKRFQWIAGDTGWERSVVDALVAHGNGCAGAGNRGWRWGANGAQTCALVYQDRC